MDLSLVNKVIYISLFDSSPVFTVNVISAVVTNLDYE